MTLTQLYADTRRNVSLQLTSTDFSDAEILVALNKWYRLVTGWAINASGIWEYSGEISKTDLVQNQSEYPFASTVVAINRVAIKYPNSTNYVYAERIDDLETKDAFENGSISRGSEAAPVFREFGNSIFIYPKPSANVTSGLSIETIEDITELTSGSDVPNLNPLVHQILSIGAACDYCDSEEMYSKGTRLERRIFGRPGGDGRDGLRYLVEELAANRDRTTRSRFIPRRTSFR